MGCETLFTKIFMTTLQDKKRDEVLRRTLATPPQPKHSKEERREGV
jgi:hypothetical protein